MKSVTHQFRVSYWLGKGKINAYHEYIIDSTSKIDAKRRVMAGMPEESKKIFHDLKAERYYPEW